MGTGSTNLAARAGRWSAEHWKTATAIWLVFVVLAVGLGRAAGVVKLEDSEVGTGETAKAQQILQRAGFETAANESVLVQSRTLTAADPAFRAAVRDVAGTLRGIRRVQNVRVGLPGQVSADRHSELVQFELRGTLVKSPDRVQPVLDAVARLQRAHPQLTVAEFGYASSTHELNKTIGKDFQKAERLSVPITFVILLFAFGAFVAAGVPVLLAFTAVLGSIGLMQTASHVFHAADATQSVMLLMGMAVGVDYSLF